MKTAVEWLIGRFHYEGFIGTYCSEEQIKSKRQIMIEIIEQAKEMEREQKHDSIEKQVSILKSTLEEMMTGFDSEEDKIDFILDICNGYNKRINL